MRDAVLILAIFAIWIAILRTPLMNEALVEKSFGGVLVSAMWALSLREYSKGYRRDWGTFLLLTLSVLFVVTLAVWDLLNDLGRRGDILASLGIVSALVWSGIIGWRHLKLGA